MKIRKLKRLRQKQMANTVSINLSLPTGVAMWVLRNKHQLANVLREYLEFRKLGKA